MYLLTPKGTKVPRVISFQNDPVNEHGIILYKILKRYYSALIFKNNSSLIPTLNGKGYYLPNGVNTDFFVPIDQQIAKKEVNLDQNKNYILFVSSFLVRNQKRIDRYEQTLRILKENFPLYNFEELKLINVERRFMPYYFNASAVHLLTSDFEGSPNSVKESICCNIPVVSTNVGNVKVMLDGAENCFVSDDNSPEILAKFIIKSIEKKSDIRKIIFQKNLDKESVAIKLKNIYSTLLKVNEDVK
jgi:teichuronic acid biosynthesis glycosyltransferase TuaC